MLIKQPRRSRLNLVRKIYFKIIDKNRTYFLLERAYASKCDGFIQLDMIQEETYLKALEDGERAEELELDDTRPDIKNTIRDIA